MSPLCYAKRETQLNALFAAVKRQKAGGAACCVLQKYQKAVDAFTLHSRIIIDVPAAVRYSVSSSIQGWQCPQPYG